MLEDLFNEMPKKGETEFHMQLCLLKTLGVSYGMHWAPGSSEESLHENFLKEGGFSLTPHALTGIMIGDLMFVFSSGQPHWTEDEEGHGPDGCFLYVWNMETKLIVSYRSKHLSNGQMSKSIFGIHALADQYGFSDVLMF